MMNHISSHRVRTQRLLDESTKVTVILTVWKRDHLEEQIVALMNQRQRPAQVWVYQCGEFVDTEKIRRKYPEIQWIKSSVNLKYFGRFSIANHVETKYAWILDDDVVPSSSWMETCLAKCESEKAIVSCAGRMIPPQGFRPEHDVERYFFGDVAPNVDHAFCKEEKTVDYGCGGWFLQTEWLKYFWQIAPLTLENGEDMHLSATCRIQSGIRTIVPRQTDRLTTGNMRLEYGRDSLSSWKKPGFEDVRTRVVDHLVRKSGWRPLLWAAG